MAQLATCATETNVCSICGRSQYQNIAIGALLVVPRCTFAAQALGSFSYMQSTQEERTGGPHIL
jgi:hypothetical protein